MQWIVPSSSGSSTTEPERLVIWDERLTNPNLIYVCTIHWDGSLGEGVEFDPVLYNRIADIRKQQAATNRCVSGTWHVCTMCLCDFLHGHTLCAACKLLVVYYCISSHSMLCPMGAKALGLARQEIAQQYASLNVLWDEAAARCPGPASRFLGT